MSNQTTDFYESIVEASVRGELWGIELSSADSAQLEFDFDSNNA